MSTITATDLADMPRIADATLASTFRWREDEAARLYRECPTAFWLAPDGEDTPLYAVAPSPAAPAVAETPIDPPVATGVLPAIGLGVGVAGPIFIATMGLVADGGTTAIERMAMSLGLALVSIPLSVPFGALAAALPVILGVSLLAWFGAERPLARRTSLWAATGAGMGLLIAALFDAGMVTIPLVLTSIACATVARRAVDWIEPELA